MKTMSKTAEKDNWNPSSWRSLPIKQQPNYRDKAKLKNVEEELGKMPGLVSPSEAIQLKKQLARVCEGKAFLLHEALICFGNFEG